MAKGDSAPARRHPPVAPRRLPLALLATALLGGCGEDPELTEIVVVVDTDITGLERLTVTADNFGDERVAEARLRDVDPILPRHLGLVHEGGPLGPITVTARAIDEDREPSTVAVERRARVFFQRGKVLRLDMALTADCIEVHELCSRDETCVAGACDPSELPASALSEWTGRVPPTLLTSSARAGGGGASPSAGAPAGEGGASPAAGSGGASSPVDAAQPTGTLDAGRPAVDAGQVDTGAPMPDAGPGPLNCADPLTLPIECHATTRDCMGPLCEFACDSGWGDCDALAVNGCETNLRVDPNHCNECGRACPASPANATACICVNGEFFLTCNAIVIVPTHGDCDGDVQNGCEADLNSDMHCGVCNNACSCSNFSCTGD